MSPKVDQWTDAVAGRLCERLHTSELPLLPKRVVIQEDTDPLAEDAWRLILVLPAPTSETWEREDVFSVRREAVAIFDDFANEDGRNLPGPTIAFVTTDEASEEDTAPEDEPEEGEDPGRAS